MDTIDTLAEIRSRQSSMNPRIGVDVKELKVAYMRKKKIIEPLVVKEQILKSATEAVSMLLRIDDVLAAVHSEKKVRRSLFSSFVIPTFFLILLEQQRDLY